MELIRTRSIRLMWDGDKVSALVGPDLQEGIAGFGDSGIEAVEDLLQNIKREEITIWIPRPATQYREVGVLKTDCPEPGHVHVMPELDSVMMYICDGST
jgi:hypothetical protein